MNTFDNTFESTATPVMSTGRLVNAYVQEAKAEVLRYLRTPGFLIPTMMFPATFYLMFGVLLAHSNSADAPRYLLASYGTFGVMAPGLFGFGVSLALERDSGLLTLKRALPMPPGAYLLGKMCMAMVVAACISLLLLGLAVFVAGVSLPPARVFAFIGVEVIGVLPFCALGLLLGTIVKGQGAPNMINLIYLPMAFLAGLWLPLSMLPNVLQNIAPVWPAYHLDQLALSAVGMGQGNVGLHLGVLAGFTVVFLALAARRLRRYG